ncbi:prepilin-type N-terminal cleavage/methylation domain-containing protein [Thalassobacillus sp. CUG 92003]|uniref:prepilin-type N-terminal cleavage/methylation domain-containing protein n=1 Tax=Thalassobacillus sp. CUG 92003 TaxID=2736641 RepID=UPI0015E635AB|nr:prepilin-type N-terminal cleavage/methylation domain-containing protein [Thalassobacillus sp. CUG 92003]
MVATIKNLASNRGFTLIEVLASIVIMTIIITIFFTLFTQSARTTHQSESIINATYTAQQEMENIYHLSESMTVSDGFAHMEDNGYAIANPGEAYILTHDKHGFHVRIEIERRSEDALNQVRVKVFENSSEEALEAQMETIVTWRVSD